MNEYFVATIGWLIIAAAMLIGCAADHIARRFAAELRARRRAKLVHKRITRSTQRLEIRRTWRNLAGATKCEK